MSTDSISRVNYFDKQYLRTEDFSDEQAYHLEMRRRHNLAHHRWGIVNGLMLGASQDGIFLGPGMAVDGYGRELILAEGLALSIDQFDAKASEKLDVWLYYHRSGSDTAPTGFNSCDEELRQAYYRWLERPRIQYEKPEPGPVRARKPDVVPEDLRDAAPYHKPVDDPVGLWPVYLGRIFRDVENTDQPYSVDLSGRPYAGLVGEGIEAPSGSASISLGRKIYYNETTGLPAHRTTELSVQLGKATNRKTHLRLDSEGSNTLSGETKVEGTLKVSDGAMAFHTGAVTIDDVEKCVKVRNQPWSIYRTACKRPSLNDEGKDELVQQLRIEMGADELRHEVVIGSWSEEDKAFKPTLTIRPDGVLVHGNLVVKGQIKHEEAAASGNLTQQAQNFLTSTFSSGIAGANSLQSKFYKSPYEGGIDFSTPEGRQFALQLLLNNPADFSAFVDLMLETTASRDIIISKILSSDTYRHTVMEYLRDNTVPLEEFTALLENPSYFPTLPEFAGSLVATDEGRRAIMDAMPVGSGPLNDFTALLETGDYNPQLPEFAGSMMATDEGRRANMDALPAASAELINFTALLGFSDYFDRQLAFASALAATVEGSTVVGDSYVNNTSQLPDMLAPLIANDTRDTLSEELLSNADGRLSVATFLVDPGTDESWLAEVIDPIVNEPVGRKATAEGLNATNVRATGFAQLDWDATLTWDADYPVLKAALVAEPGFCP